MTPNPDTPHDTPASPHRAAMQALAEQMLRERLPLHEVDQYMASLRDLVEFKVFVHHFDENRFKSVNMWSVDLAEAAGEALRAFEHDGWLVTNVIRVSDNPYMNEESGSDDEPVDE